MPKSTFYNLPDSKKQRIIEAAYNEFIANSYESVAVSNITSRANIPVGSFYQYFYDKDDLYLFLFLEIDLKIADYCKKHNTIYSEIKRSDDLYEIFTEKELVFYDTWYNIPDDVLRKFYFGEYDNRLFDICRKKIKEYKAEGKLINDVDEELLLFIYVTSTFNVYMFCRKNNIFEEREILKFKDQYFSKILGHGIFKK